MKSVMVIPVLKEVLNKKNFIIYAVLDEDIVFMCAFKNLNLEKIIGQSQYLIDNKFPNYKLQFAALTKEDGDPVLFVTEMQDKIKQKWNIDFVNWSEILSVEVVLQLSEN